MKKLWLFLFAAAVLSGAVCAPAQNFSYPNFHSVAGLVLNGSAAQGVPTPPELAPVLRLMDGLGSNGQASSAWYNVQVPVSGAFTVQYVFNINHCVGIGCADGFAFVIQNSVDATAALGGFGGYLGYSSAPGVTGIENSLAIEFDDFQNFNFLDPNANHVAAQSCGTSPNTADHSTCRLSISPHLPITLPDGANHTVELTYTPGSLNTFIDGAAVMHTAVDLSSLLSLNGGNAYIGFTAGAGSGGQNADILNWSFRTQWAGRIWGERNSLQFSGESTRVA
jgi:hypothetical protein